MAVAEDHERVAARDPCQANAGLPPKRVHGDRLFHAATVHPRALDLKCIKCIDWCCSSEAPVIAAVNDPVPWTSVNAFHN